MIRSIDKLGREIQNLRKARKLSQAQLAEKAGLSVRFISAIERNERRPTLESLGRIARALDTHAQIGFLNPQGPKEVAITELLDFLSDKSPDQVIALLQIARIITRFN